MVGKLGKMGKKDKARGKGGRIPAWRARKDVKGESGFEEYRAVFIQHLRLKNFTELSIRQSDQALRLFVAYLQANGIFSIHRVGKDNLEEYKIHLKTTKNNRGARYCQDTIRERVQTIQRWFKFLKKKSFIPSDPTVDVIVRRGAKRLPRGVLTVEEIKKVMELPDLRTARGYRDRTVMEVLYSTGVRAAELSNLLVQDIDLKKKVARIRRGKGGKERFVILSSPCIRFLSRYLKVVRPELARGIKMGGNSWLKKFQTGGDLLFLSSYGGSLQSAWLGMMMKKFIRQAGITKDVSPVHSFRHSVATHLMESGMDVRYVQSFLGHNCINSTQIYTHVERKTLQKQLKKTHPREVAVGTFQPFVEEVS